jgi:hypothetical protein
MAREIKYLLRKPNHSKGDRHIRNLRYHDDRPTKGSKKGQTEPDDMPQKEGMGGTRKGNWTNGVDTSLVKRWLYSQVGKDFDHVYSEFLKRVQPKYIDTHRDCIYWYVVRKKLVVIKEDGIWEKSEWAPGSGTQHLVEIGKSKWSRFFVHPDTNILHVASTYKRKKNEKINKV